MLEAVFQQGDVNHITGDIHYITIFLDKKKTVLTIHDCGFMDHPNRLARVVLYWFWLKLPVMRCHTVTVISEATRQEVINYTSCAPEKVKVVPNFVSDGFKHKPKAFDHREPIILQIGTKHNKNIPRLARALQGIACKLFIVGKPRLGDENALRQHSIAYEWRANLSEHELLLAYQQCDLLTFVSTLEGFGLPIVEAQAVGRPVITSNISAMPEVAGKGACLVDPYDVTSIRGGVLKVIEDAQYRNNLVEKGLENVKRFRPQTIARQYEQLYREVQKDDD